MCVSQVSRFPTSPKCQTQAKQRAIHHNYMCHLILRAITGRLSCAGLADFLRETFNDRRLYTAKPTSTQSSQHLNTWGIYPTVQKLSEGLPYLSIRQASCRTLALNPPPQRCACIYTGTGFSAPVAPTCHSIPTQHDEFQHTTHHLSFIDSTCRHKKFQWGNCCNLSVK